MFVMGIFVGVGLYGVLDFLHKRLAPKPVPIKTNKKKG